MKSAQVPVQEKEFQQYILRRGNAIAKALPKERIQVVGDHSYISINELVDHIMAHGIDLDLYDPQTNNNDQMNKSRAMHAIVQQLQSEQQYCSFTKIGYIMLWSDAFQVNFVWSKTTSTWILTVVLSPPKT